MSILDQIQHIPGGISALKSWLGDGGHPVENSLAQKRTDTCISCPANAHGFSVTAPVAAAIKKVVEVRNAALLRTQGIKKLGTCEICTCHLPTKIFVPMELIKPTITAEERLQFAEKNPKCWQITENQ